MTAQDWMTLGEALKECLRAGMTRRQAKRWLMKKLASGDIPATTSLGDKHRAIPPNFFQGQWSDTEGDSSDNEFFC